jgi:hypothetical protein
VVLKILQMHPGGDHCISRLDSRCFALILEAIVINDIYLNKTTNTAYVERGGGEEDRSKRI